MKKPSSERTRFTAYITAFALTKGVYETEVEDCFNVSPTMVQDVFRHAEFYRNKEWHRTKQEAISYAEEMRANKLKSLDKQRKRIEGLKFS